MSGILKQFIGADQVADEHVRLDNQSYLRGRNFAGNGDINLLKVNASDIPEFGVQPQFGGSNLATESYVASFGASNLKQSVACVARANVALTGEQTIDGVLTSASRILLVGQTAGAENGIYVTAAGAWARASDLNADAEAVPGLAIYVAGGTNYGDSLWFLDTQGAITLDTTSIAFVKVSSKDKKENLTLDATDVGTNFYKDSAYLILPDSLNLSVGGVMQYEGLDYTLSTVGGVTRITFAGGLAVGGGQELVAGNILRLQHRI